MNMIRRHGTPSPLTAPRSIHQAAMRPPVIRPTPQMADRTPQYLTLRTVISGRIAGRASRYPRPRTRDVTVMPADSRGWPLLQSLSKEGSGGQE
jgi:hypothetical protein